MRYTWILILTVISTLFSCNHEPKQTSKVLNLPLMIVDGFGPFQADYGLLSPEYTADNQDGKDWVKTYLPVTGIPSNWKNVVKSMISFDMRQLVYQNFYAGNVSQKTYDRLQKSWEWKPDPNYLSKAPIKCYVYVVRGVDHSGKVAVIIDTNNNLDFTDEKAFYPESCTAGPDMRKYKNVSTVSYETFSHGKTRRNRLPMIIKHITDQPQNRDYAYSIPQYAQATLKYNNLVYLLAVRRGFSIPDYEIPEIVVQNKADSTRYGFFDGVGKSEVLSLGNPSNPISYRNKGVDVYRNTLELESFISDQKQFAVQIGYHFQPFEAKEFTTGKIIKTSSYKRKYVFIDFWGTWCKPCVEELPDLQNIYGKINKEKIEFISIACMDSPEKLSVFLKNRPTPWPQILSDSTNKLVETYSVQGFPFNLIVDPDGKIVARNLHKEALKKKLSELSKM